jgi:hypothetical protein
VRKELEWTTRTLRPEQTLATTTTTTTAALHCNLYHPLKRGRLPTYRGPPQHDSNRNHDFDRLPTVTPANGASVETTTTIACFEDQTTKYPRCA